jgi:hypothetical protein
MSDRIWTCAVCRKQERWGKSWSWFGSRKDEDDWSREVLEQNAVCSDACKALHKPIKFKQTAAEIATEKRLRKQQRKAPRSVIDHSRPSVLVDL